MNLSTKIIAASAFCLLLAACAGRKEISSTDPTSEAGEILKSLDSLSNQQVNTFYTKFSTQYQDSSRNISFKTSFRMIIDSIFNADIKYASIPVVNILVDKDSIKVVNRKDKCTTFQAIDMIKKQFGADFTHRNLEELFLGFPVGIDSKKNYYKEKHESQLVLCSHSKKVLKHLGETDTNVVVTRYFLSADRTEFKKFVLESVRDKVIVEVDYGPRTLVSGIGFPDKLTLKITTPAQVINVEMEYSKTRINEVEDIYFVIPENYEDCPK